MEGPANDKDILLIFLFFKSSLEFFFDIFDVFFLFVEWFFLPFNAI